MCTAVLYPYGGADGAFQYWEVVVLLHLHRGMPVAIARRAVE